jgi:hypothetical protein
MKTANESDTRRAIASLAPLMRYMAALNFDFFLEAGLDRYPRAHFISAADDEGMVGDLSASLGYVYHLHGLAMQDGIGSPVLIGQDYAGTQTAFQKVQHAVCL